MMAFFVLRVVQLFLFEKKYGEFFLWMSCVNSVFVFVENSAPLFE